MTEESTAQITFTTGTTTYKLHIYSVQQYKGSFDLDVKQTPNPQQNDAIVVSVGKSISNIQLAGVVRTADYGDGLKSGVAQVIEFESALKTYRGTEFDGLMQLKVSFPDVERTFQGVLRKFNYTINAGDTEEVSIMLSFAVGIPVTT